MKLNRTIRSRALPACALAFALIVAACGERTGPLPTDSDADAESPVGRVQSPTGADLAMAVAIHDRHTPALMNIKGVVGTGVAVDGKKTHITIYTLREGVRGIPAAVDGIPVETIVTGRFFAGDINNPTTRERPAPNGFSIGHPDITAGTLGAVVRDGSDVCYALSNNHVLANANDASIGDNALQPGPFDGGSNPADAIGSLADFEAIAFNGSNNTIDAAIAELFDPADVTAATPDYAYGAPGTNPVNATVGMNVKKFGRTTGLTNGQIAEVNVTVDVCYEGRFRCTKLARFVDQITISPGSFSDGGDSGSLIVRSSDESPVGLLFAGSSTRTIANPIGDVLSRFGVSIETNTANCAGGGEPANDPPTAAFSFSASNLTVNFTDESSDSDGNVVAWDWDFGDGSGSTAQNPSHTYLAADSYTVTLTVTDDDGDTDATSQTVVVEDGSGGGDFTLSVDGRKVRGRHTIDLTWSGATTADVDIFRNGALLATTANDGAYTDATNNRGKGTYTYEVCEEGTSVCSNEATAEF